MNIFLRKSEDRSKPNRRDFMLQTGCAGLGLTSVVNTIAQLKMVGAAAAAAGPGDYKALVCLFMNGGVDSNNLLIPSGSSTARTDYQSGRGFLAIPDANFDYTPRNAANGYWNGASVSQAAVSTRLAPDNVGLYNPPTRASGYCGAEMALHPGAYPLAKMFADGDLSFIGNIGTLTRPGVTRGNFGLASTPKPPQLFSHSDQQTQWQSSIPDKPFTSGWGGRIADLLSSSVNNGDLSMSVSIAGVNSLQVGVQVQPYVMNSSGSVSSLTGFGSPYTNALRNTGLQPDYTNPAVPAGTKYNPMAPVVGGADPLAATNYQHSAAGWRLRAIEQVLAMSHASLFDETYIDVPQSARVTEGLVGNALAATAAPNPTLDTHFDNWFPTGLFNPRITDFASQLRVVARMIAGRSVLGNSRQIFFVQLGGWDTHTSQIPTTATPETQGQYALINNLSRSVAAFRDAMNAIGMWDNVVMFSASDFSRTMNANKADATAGSDHAWGGNAFLAGGPVNGRKIYGKFADLTKNGGIDCQGNSGRWIPNVAVDQYAATLAKWFGVSDAQLASVFPNLSRFMPSGITNSELISRNLDMFTF